MGRAQWAGRTFVEEEDGLLVGRQLFGELCELFVRLVIRLQRVLLLLEVRLGAAGA